ncbi:MAG: redoxin domain-containing protein [Alphaproteobacteria bacterium]|nr:redoxin domain-containing protein [Alphaproteobacteria bacterium]
MNKGIYFILGLVIAGVGTAGYWALTTPPKHTDAPKKEAKKVSLLTINFIPTAPAKPITEGKYWEFDSSSESAPNEKDLKDLQGKPVILHFWATWCAPCVQEFPELDTFADKYKNGAHVLAVATDAKNIDKIKEFYKTKGIKTLNIALDKYGSLSRYFQASALPTTVFINSKGEEIGRIQGAVEWSGTAGRLLNTYLSRN